MPRGIEDILLPLLGWCSSDNDLHLNSVVVVAVVVVVVAVVVLVGVGEGGGAKHWLETGKCVSLASPNKCWNSTSAGQSSGTKPY